VPATVKAKVPEVVIGDPDTEIKPPVNDCATLVTVPVVGVVQVGADAEPWLVNTCPEVPYPVVPLSAGVVPKFVDKPIAPEALITWAD